MNNIVQFQRPASEKVSAAPKMTHIPAVWVPDELIRAGLEDLALKQSMRGLGIGSLTAAEKLLMAIVEATEPEGNTYDRD